MTDAEVVEVPLAHRIRLWVDEMAKRGAVFTPEGTLLKIEEELGELKADPDDPIECADIIIAAIAYAHTKGWSIERYIAEKMDTNEDREWVLQSDGNFRHA